MLLEKERSEGYMPKKKKRKKKMMDEKLFVNSVKLYKQYILKQKLK